MTELRIATQESYKDKSGERQKRTEWHRVTVWGKMAEACAKYLAKGRQVYVEGRLQTRSYDKDGEKKFVTEIIAADVQFLGQNGVNNVNQAPISTLPISDDDIPF